MKDENCYTVAVNNPTPPLKADAVFFGNQRRFLQHHSQITKTQQIIFGPTIAKKAEELVLRENVSRIMLKNAREVFPKGVFPETSGIMAVLVCAELGFKKIFIAGMDGLKESGKNYYYSEQDPIEENSTIVEINSKMSQELLFVKSSLEPGIQITLITPTILLS
jgi:hypothetical protein